MNKMNNKKIDSKSVLIILLCAVSIIIILVTFLNIKGIYDTKNKIREELILTNQYNSQIAVLNSIKAQETDINSILLQYKYKIPAEPYENKIIEFINDISAGAELLGVTFAERIPNDIATEMPVKINMKSDYFTMMKILNDITGADRFFTIQSIDITSYDNAALNYIINISAYYKADT